jgi:uncharacterized protein YjbJ (UPF0337 family)
MPDVPDRDEPEIDEAPATWENIVEGELEKLVGEITRDKALVEEGEERVEIAHEVREEYREQRDERTHGHDT